ncbi:MAG: hypothetical protein NZ602_05150 [Thermoguttaceae bacterium]|nr:hypothetical protein [Thermoguttaceae bacterium]MDW8036714.1 hypothetical protein [Thermoguttaceae bacterium]
MRKQKRAAAAALVLWLGVLGGPFSVRADEPIAPLNGTANFPNPSSNKDELYVNSGNATILATEAFKIQGPVDSRITVIQKEGSGSQVHVATISGRIPCQGEGNECFYRVVGIYKGPGSGSATWKADYNYGGEGGGEPRIVMWINKAGDHAEIKDGKIVFLDRETDDLIGLNVNWTSLYVKLVNGQPNVTYTLTLRCNRPPQNFWCPDWLEIINFTYSILGTNKTITWETKLPLSSSGTAAFFPPEVKLSSMDPEKKVRIKGLSMGRVEITGTCNPAIPVQKIWSIVVPPIRIPCGNPEKEPVATRGPGGTIRDAITLTITWQTANPTNEIVFQECQSPQEGVVAIVECEAHRIVEKPEEFRWVISECTSPMSNVTLKAKWKKSLQDTTEKEFGEDMKCVALYQDKYLPPENTAFGKKTIRLWYKDEEVCSTAEQNIEIFFPAEGCRHPSGYPPLSKKRPPISFEGRVNKWPNWLYYWSQVWVEKENSLLNELVSNQKWIMLDYYYPSPDYYGPWVNAIDNNRWQGVVRRMWGFVPAMMFWNYTKDPCPFKTTIVVSRWLPNRGAPYDCGLEYTYSGIDMFMALVIHEGIHVDQIRRADEIVSYTQIKEQFKKATFRFGWSFNQKIHNHWAPGPDKEWGKKVETTTTMEL